MFYFHSNFGAKINLSADGQVQHDSSLVLGQTQDHDCQEKGRQIQIMGNEMSLCYG
jgi:hypothetical protein